MLKNTNSPTIAASSLINRTRTPKNNNMQSVLDSMLASFKKSLSTSAPTTNAKQKSAQKSAIDNLFVSHQNLGNAITMSNDAARAITQTGVPLEALQAIQVALQLPVLEAYELVRLDRSQASRLRSEGRALNEFQSARALRAMALTALAVEVFGTSEAAAQWLKRPHPLLNGETPLLFAVSEFGAAEIRNMLVAIRYGGVV
jgi:putative toxin-antitoxin system antitoxin component (TIGR02293 family)